MGNLPQITPPAGIPIHLSTPAYLMDHHFQGRPVLPAVEAMEALARTAKEALPQLAVHHLVDIRFDKFLYLDPSRDGLDALADLQPSENNGLWQACLSTRTQTPKASMTRTRVHARLCFSQVTARPERWPMDVAAAPEGICIEVSPEKLYGELVPFGPAYQNIEAPVFISPDGALARIRTPDASPHSCLGSPYALDAALHAACAWSQHFKGIVAFPVAMASRIIARPTRPEEVYYGRIRPSKIHDDLLVFDIQLLDMQGDLCESIQGVQMRDVSGGRLMPPQGFIRKQAPDPLEEIGKACHALTVVELNAVAPFASQALTQMELERFDRMGIPRRKSFLAARLALKRLYRRCRDHEARMLPATAIETVCKDTPLPCCGDLHAAAGPGLNCSVSHDRRLAIAVVHPGNIGVDVEEVTQKALRTNRIYMHEHELELARQSQLESQSAALRIWSIKEAAAKAFGQNLAEAWQAVQVTELGLTQSWFKINDEIFAAQHAAVDNHLVTIVARRQNMPVQE
jgi:phosphopantetheinyl transferase